MLSTVLVATLSPILLYASDKGNDEWQGTQRRPFRSLERIHRELLTYRAKGDLRPAILQLRGEFVLAKEWELGPEFNDTTIKGKAILHGSSVLDTWTETQVGGRTVWAAKTPDSALYRQLFVNGQRRPRARLPKAGFYHLAGLTQGAEKSPWNEGQSEAHYNPADFRAFSNVSDIDFVAHHFWVQSRMKIKEVDEETKTVRFDRKSVFRLSEDFAESAAPYRLENVLEGMTEPGEWVSDTSRERILYLPKKGERLGGFMARVSSLPTLLKIQNVRKLNIQEISFEGTEWNPPADKAGDPQAAISVPGAVVLEDAIECAIERCSVRNAGTYGLEIVSGRDNLVQSCDFRDLGGGGIKIGHGSRGTKALDCAIVGVGRIFAPAIGIWIGNSGGNLISHNLIRDLYYTGISVGWVWGYGPSQAVGNVIEYNDIRDVGHGELSDMGGIYTLGVSPGTVLHHNRIRNVEARGYGGWGIYLDEGSTNIVVENNLVQDTKSGGFHQHYGRDNLIRNNVFMNARTPGQIIRTRAEDHRSFTFENNIVLWKDTDLLAGNWEGSGYRFDGNIYWRTDAKAVSFAGKTFDDWRKRGMDATSVIDDPKVKVSEAGVYLPLDSVARRTGIKPIEMSQVGPRRKVY